MTALRRTSFSRVFSAPSERQSSLRRREDAVAWFYSILRHTLVDYLRKWAVEARGKEAYSQALIHSGQWQGASI